MAHIKLIAKIRALVSLTLKNDSGLFSLPTSEVEISRIVHRDGVNEYLVNSEKTRLKDKMEFLSSANIGPTGHHIVTQGEADKFITANPAERRELLEDALGLNVFKLRRKEALGKISKTTESLREVKVHIDSLEPQVRYLGKEVERLEKIAGKRSTLLTLAREMLSSWQRVIADEGLQFEEQINNLEQNLEKYQFEYEHLKGQETNIPDIVDNKVKLKDLNRERSQLLSVSVKYTRRNWRLKAQN